MNLKLLLYIILHFLLLHTAFGQNSVLDRHITISLENVTIHEALKAIGEGAEIDFSYDPNILFQDEKISIQYHDETVGVVLNELIKNLNVEIKLIKNQVVFHKPKSNVDALKKNKDFLFSGRTIDQTSGVGIEGVHVFVANSTYITVTDEEGQFSMSMEKMKQFELVFSHVGYLPHILKVNNIAQIEKAIEVKLTPRMEELAEVVVSIKKDKSWEENLGVFEKSLLGETNNSTMCKLKNPWVLEFEKDPNDNLLKASADELLIIENKALGYTMKCQLLLFEKGEEGVRSLLKPYFEELESRNRVQLRKWQKARKKTYLGSMRHFIQALVSNDLQGEGFNVELVEMMPGGEITSSRKIQTNEVVNRRSDSTFRLSFNGYMQVTYFKGIESKKYAYWRYKIANNHTTTNPETFQNQPQKSWIREVDKPIEITSEGTLIDPISVEREGYWGWKRMADELPSNYTLN